MAHYFYADRVRYYVEDLPTLRFDNLGGAKVPVEIRAVLDPEDKDAHPYRIEVHVELVNGRLGVSELTLRRRPDGPPLTSEMIRSVAVGELVRWLYDKHGGGGSLSTLSVDGLEPTERRKEGQTERVLTAVADTYRFAYVVNEPPTQAVMAYLDCSRATAKRWIAAAREHGLLDLLPGED